MFTTLIESHHSRVHRERETALSLLIHVTLIAFLIKVGVTGATPERIQAVEKLVFAEVPKEPPPPEPQQKPMDVPQAVINDLPAAKGFQVLSAPISIPTVLPDIDLSKAATREEDFSGRGVAGGVASGVVGGAVKPADEARQAYFQFQVEKVASPLQNNPTFNYPEVLKGANVTGSVVVQFVVDTAGRVDANTVRIMTSTHPAFSASVRQTIVRWRFMPAEISGRHVRMLAQLPVEFSLNP